MSRSSREAELRRRVLTRLLRSSERIRTSEAAERLGVTAMTIRRDLAALASAGVAIRSYGGAVPAGRITFEYAFSQRHLSHLPEKRRIAAAAVGRVRPGDTVFVDTGTTTLALARALARTRRRCTVVTSSLAVAAELWSREPVALVLLGGRVRDGSPDLAGAETEAALRQMRADVAFVGSDGVDPQRGSFADDAEVAGVAALMVRRARRVIVVADADKLGRTAAARFARIQDVDELITDRRASGSLVAAMRRRGVKVTLA